MAITKYVLPVVAGAMAGIILISLGEFGIHHIYPLLAGANLHDKTALVAFIAQMPVMAFILLLANYAVCSFAAGCIATLVAGRTSALPALVVGIALTMAGLFNIMMVPQPIWFCVLNLLVYLPFTWLGYLVSRGWRLGI